MSNYGWVITKVYDPDCQDEIGTMGPSDIDEGIATHLKNTMSLSWRDHDKYYVPFRCFTDDRNDTGWDFDGPPGLIYEGLLWLKDGVNGDDGMGLFGPLNDFCEPNYGCAMIEHYVDNKWEQIVA